MKYIIRNRTYNEQYKTTMKSTTKNQSCFHAVIKQNGKRKRETAMISGEIGVIRKIPVVDVHYMPSDSRDIVNN